MGKKIKGYNSRLSNKFSRPKNRCIASIMDNGNGIYLKTKSNNYKLLPQAKLFICFSANTSNEVLTVQNELLLANLSPKQYIDWRPMAWNAMGNICAFGDDKHNAQGIINKCADSADHIIFVVKEKVYKGVWEEWKFWTKNSKGKTIYLFIYDDDNKQKIHQKLDPSKNIIYHTYSSYKDILISILREIPQTVTQNLETQNLSFIKTTLEMRQYQEYLHKRIKYIETIKYSEATVSQLKTFLKFIESNQHQIICNNRNQMNLVHESMGMKKLYHISPIPMTPIIDTRHLFDNLLDKRIVIFPKSERGINSAINSIESNETPIK